VQARNEVTFQLHDNVFYGMAPPPFATGSIARAMPSGLFNFLPPIHQAEETPFEERIQKGFKYGYVRRIRYMPGNVQLDRGYWQPFLAQVVDILTLKHCSKSPK